MAYTPINWQTGDTITAEKMNKMDNGWSVDSTQLFSESVTTEQTEDGNYAELSYATFIDADAVVITFNGVDYTCTNYSEDEDVSAYGAQQVSGSYDFSVYPFVLVSSNPPVPILPVGNDFYTENAGTFTVSVGTIDAEVSDNFKMAVNVANPYSFRIQVGVTTWQEVYDAVKSGKLAFWVVQYNDTYEFFVVSHVGPSGADYVVGAVFYNGFVVGDKLLQASSADGVLNEVNS